MLLQTAEIARADQPAQESGAISSLHGIVLAGSYPRYHSALDRLSPRPLLPVAHQPLIAYALRWLSGGGLAQATICANAAARTIRTLLEEESLGLRLSYREDWTPRGAAGCVRDAAIATDARTLVVADGTTVPTAGLRDLLRAHRQSGAALTVVVGPCVVGEERLRPTGVYVFDRRVIASIPDHGFQDIKETLVPSLYRAGEQVSIFAADGVPPRALDNESYLALNDWAVERSSRGSTPEDGFRTEGQALVHETAAVDPDARLLGPVVLGPRVSVQSGATVIGPSSIGAGSSVGRDAVVSRSAVWSRCTVGDGAFVHRSMLADDSVVSSRAALYSEMKVPTLRRDPRQSPSSKRTGHGVWSAVAASLGRPAPHPR